MAANWDEFEVYRSRAYSAGEDISQDICSVINRQRRSSISPRPHTSSHREADGAQYGGFRKRHSEDVNIKPSGDYSWILNRIHNLNTQDNEYHVRNESPTECRDEQVSTTNISECSNEANSDQSPHTESISPDQRVCESHDDGSSHKRSLSYYHHPPSHHSLAWKQISDVPARRRTYSMPSRNRHGRQRSRSGECEAKSNCNPQNDSSYIRIRTFSTSSKGIISRRDSFKRRAVASVEPMSSPKDGRKNGRERCRTWSGGQLPIECVYDDTIADPHHHHKVVVLGSHGVGKSSVIHQFMTAEYLANQNLSFDDDKTCAVSVVLDGEESLLEFIEHTSVQRQEDIPDGDAYVVVFAVSEQDTFHEAIDSIMRLQNNRKWCSRVIILVANKQDIVRHRQVEEAEGRKLAIRYHTKYIETSAIINHNVDDLLVGILKQIRLKEKQRGKKNSMRCLPIGVHDEDGCLQLSRLFRSSQAFTSCDNLLVL